VTAENGPKLVRENAKGRLHRRGKMGYVVGGRYDLGSDRKVILGVPNSQSSLFG